MWRKGNSPALMDITLDLSQKAEKQSPALMVGIKIGAATMENSMEFLPKIKNRTTI